MAKAFPRRFEQLGVFGVEAFERGGYVRATALQELVKNCFQARDGFARRVYTFASACPYADVDNNETDVLRWNASIVETTTGSFVNRLKSCVTLANGRNRLQLAIAYAGGIARFRHRPITGAFGAYVTGPNFTVYWPGAGPPNGFGLWMPTELNLIGTGATHEIEIDFQADLVNGPLYLAYAGATEPDMQLADL